MAKIFYVFIFAAAILAQSFNADEVKISDSLYKKISEKESKFFSINQIDGKNRYFICSCENFDIPYQNGLKILQNYKNYENQFKYILKSQNTGENNWLFILGIPFVKTWLWGDVSEETNGNFVKISFVKTKSEVNYSDSVKSIVVIDFDKLVLQWSLIKIKETNSRFCLTGMAQPQKPVPQWLIKTALKKVVPRTLKNIKNTKSNL